MATRLRFHMLALRRRSLKRKPEPFSSKVGCRMSSSTRFSSSKSLSSDGNFSAAMPRQSMLRAFIQQKNRRSPRRVSQSVTNGQSISFHCLSTNNAQSSKWRRVMWLPAKCAAACRRRKMPLKSAEGRNTLPSPTATSLRSTCERRLQQIVHLPPLPARIMSSNEYSPDGTILAKFAVVSGRLLSKENALYTHHSDVTTYVP